MSFSVLSANNIDFNYRETKILNGVDVRISAGDVVGLLGSNGAGKTTFFDILGGLKNAASGAVTGVQSAERIAYLTQVITIPDALKLGELAELVQGISNNSATSLRNLVSMLGSREQDKFKALYNRRAAGCSHGEKRWFVFLTLISTDADVYILDEPTAGVDPEYSVYILRTLIKLKEKGKSVLFSTHQISEISNYCDYFYFLKNGSVKRFRNATEFAETNNAKSLDEAFIKYVTADVD